MAYTVLGALCRVGSVAAINPHFVFVLSIVFLPSVECSLGRYYSNGSVNSSEKGMFFNASQCIGPEIKAVSFFFQFALRSILFC